LILVVFLALICAAVIIFVLENQQMVALQFLGFTVPSLPSAAVVLLALMVGFVIGPVLMVLSRFKMWGGGQ
jgi:uncharacterized integral membrane protein